MAIHEQNLFPLPRQLVWHTAKEAKSMLLGHITRNGFLLLKYMLIVKNTSLEKA